MDRQELEKAIENEETVYGIKDYTKEVYESKLTKNHIVLDNPKNLFKKREEAEWVADNWKERTEHFQPPFELERGDSYEFVSKKYGNAEIFYNWDTHRPYEVSDERADYGERMTFNTYQEAVEYAKKLFEGVEDE